MMAATLIPANQYSASPKNCINIRFSSVMPPISPRSMANIGEQESQPLVICPPTTASKPNTIPQKQQYSQPVM